MHKIFRKSLWVMLCLQTFFLFQACNNNESAKGTPFEITDIFLNTIEYYADDRNVTINPYPRYLDSIALGQLGFKLSFQVQLSAQYINKSNIASFWAFHPSNIHPYYTNDTIQEIRIFTIYDFNDSIKEGDEMSQHFYYFNTKNEKSIIQKQAFTFQIKPIIIASGDRIPESSDEVYYFHLGLESKRNVQFLFRIQCTNGKIFEKKTRTVYLQ